ncbi:MAG TPA: hypothetical protein VMW58_04925 [Anaerolineae bacterium]|nr:hypothetical protein [Anaerolineae bacterium]
MTKKKGASKEAEERLARAIIDAAAYREPVVGLVTSVANLANGSILCDIGSMLGVQVIARPMEGIAVDDLIFVKKIGSGPTSRWMFDGFNVGGGGGGSGTGYTPVQRIETLVSHASTHQDGAADEINVGGLSGDLADAQDPKSHASTHQDGGADEISVAGLSGELADAQPPKSHASSHQNGGADEISVAGLNGVLADQQDANKIKAVDVIDTSIGDGKVLVYRDASGDLGYEAQAGGGGADEKVKVSSDDTTADYLINKLTAQGPITLTEVGGGGDEDLRIGYARGNIKWVAKSGGDYSTVTAAMAAITDAAADNRYVILIAPDLGWDQVTLKSYVDLIGLGTTLYSSTSSIAIEGAPTDVSIRNLVIARINSVDNDDNPVLLTGGNVDFHHCRILESFTTSWLCATAYIIGGTHRFFGCEIRNFSGGYYDRGGNAVTVGNATVDFYGGYIEADGSYVTAAHNHGIYVASGGTVNIHQGTTIRANGGKALYNSSSTINVYSAEYDPDDTSGTITGADKDTVIGELTVIDDINMTASRTVDGVDVSAHAAAEPFDAHLNNPSCRVYKAASQSIGSGGWVAVQFDGEHWDTDSIHNNAVNNTRLTCKTAGIYLMIGHGQFTASAGGVARAMGVRITYAVGGTNFLTIQNGIVSAAMIARMVTDTLWSMAVNDYIELLVYQDTGGNLNLEAQSHYSPRFMMTRVA